MDRIVAECVGLWLAEGDSKTHAEITFSNSEPTLIRRFHTAMQKIFPNWMSKVRIYVYTSKKEIVSVPVTANRIRRYVDKRARKPHFIWRLASIELSAKWKKIVQECKDDKSSYADTLRGFFAGEGNVKTGSHQNRTIRIAQLKSEFVEKLLAHFEIEYKYREKERSYYITHRKNWIKLAKIRIADIHPVKREKFWSLYHSFKQYHYARGYLKKSVFKKLVRPYSSCQLAKIFQRSRARIFDVLGELKKEKKIEYFQVGSMSYWIRKDQNLLIISDKKRNYLTALKNYKTTTKLSRYFDVCPRSSSNRLIELEKLGLVRRSKDKSWEKIATKKRIVVL